MAEDYNCPVCGKHFVEEEERDNHKKMDHQEFNEMYANEQEGACPVCTPEKWNSATPEERKNALDAHDAFLDDLETSWEEIPPEVKADLSTKEHGEPDVADELEGHQEKPIQSHDDWQKELEGLRDEFATEENKCAICNGEHPTAEHPVLAKEEEDELVIDNDEDLYALHKGLVDKPISEEEDDEHPRINISYGYGDDAKKLNKLDDIKGEEEGGADDPLQKVADLAESYRFMSRDRRTQIFESLGFGQKDSVTLSGLEWNELSRPVKVEASEAYKKVSEQEPETGEDPDDEEDEIYENFYNLEKNHLSPDYKKKAITCIRCNEAFYNTVDRDVHFNEVHATEQEYELPEECPLCDQIIQEPETLDWHMQQEHGAHVPSQFTQTGIQSAMADTDFDALESNGDADRYLEDMIRDQNLGSVSKAHVEQNMRASGFSDEEIAGAIRKRWGEARATEAKWECLDCDSKFDDAGKHQEETGHHNIARYKGEETLSMQQRSKLYQWAKQNDDKIGYGFDAQDIPYDLYIEIENMNPSETFHQDATQFVIDTATESYAKEDDLDDIIYKQHHGKNWWEDDDKEESEEDIDSHSPEEMIRREHELMGEKPSPEEEQVHQQLKKEFGEGYHIDLEDTTKYIDDPDEEDEDEEDDEE